MERKSPYHCSICGVLKTSENASICKATKSGFHTYCKTCMQEYARKRYAKIMQDNPNYHKENYKQNKEHVKAWSNKQRKKYPERYKEYAKKHYYLNKEKCTEATKKWRDTARGKLIQAECQARYREKSHDKDMARAKRYRHNHINVRIAFSIRQRMRGALKGTIKSSASIELLGCNPEQLKEYLESRFLPNMTWDNYGKYGWHIGHIRPCSSFDLTDPEQQKQCFHYTNLQPLWAKDNLRKGGRWDGYNPNSPAP